MSAPEFLTPQWPAPPNVRAAFTLRQGGVSLAPYASLNLAMHVGDEPSAVADNRRRVREALSLPAEPVWLTQVHGADVIALDELSSASSHHADAVVSHSPNHVCAIQVADCLPVLFAARDGSAVAAAHAGWRGLAGGVLEAAVRRMKVEPSQLIAWLGPAIGPASFEVGGEVRAAFVAHDSAAAMAFAANDRERWQCDIYSLAYQRLEALGVQAVFGDRGLDTYADPQRFFSFRRDGRCGRMAALIWT